MRRDVRILRDGMTGEHRIDQRNGWCIESDLVHRNL